MQNTKNIPLDLTGGWEDIVNNVERHNARVRFDAKLRQRKLDRMKQKMINLSLGAVLALVLGFTGLAVPWVAVAAAMGQVCLACVMGGKLLAAYGR